MEKQMMLSKNGNCLPHNTHDREHLRFVLNNIESVTLIRLDSAHMLVRTLVALTDKIEAPKQWNKNKIKKKTRSDDDDDDKIIPTHSEKNRDFQTFTSFVISFFF